MRDKFMWPAVAIICSTIIASGIYLGLRDSRIRQTTPSRRTFEEIIAEPQSEQMGSGTSAKVEENKDDPIVYVTRTGACYHRATCGYLLKSKIPMKLSEARKRYRPCSKCRPPQ
jgi:hypothetical protein